MPRPLSAARPQYGSSSGGGPSLCTPPSPSPASRAPAAAAAVTHARCARKISASSPSSDTSCSTSPCRTQLAAACASSRYGVSSASAPRRSVSRSCALKRRKAFQAVPGGWRRTEHRRRAQYLRPLARQEVADRGGKGRVAQVVRAVRQRGRVATPKLVLALRARFDAREPLRARKVRRRARVSPGCAAAQCAGRVARTCVMASSIAW